MLRLVFSFAVILLLAGTLPAQREPADDRIRVAAANLVSGRRVSYDAGHGIRILQALQPDIAAIQGFFFRDSSPASLRDFVDRSFGRSFYYHRATLPRPDLANGIISRWPIVRRGVWTDPYSVVAWASIDIPGNVDLWVVSVSLWFETERRRLQTRDLAAAIRQTIPSGDFLVIAGTLNMDSWRDPALLSLTSVVTLPSQPPSDQRGRTGSDRDRSTPLDMVLANHFSRYQTPVEIVGQSFPYGLIFDSRVFQPLRDMYPVLADDSAAPGMEHMAVIRDFALTRQPSERDLRMAPRKRAQ